MVTILDSGAVRFEIYLPHAARVELVGDFTDWSRDALPLARRYPGFWSVTRTLAPGRHAFCYRVDGFIHQHDAAVPENSMDRDGRRISYIDVPQPDSPLLRPRSIATAAAPLSGTALLISGVARRRAADPRPDAALSSSTGPIAALLRRDSAEY